eukprot:Pgem_evm1s14595
MSSVAAVRQKPAKDVVKLPHSNDIGAVNGIFYESSLNTYLQSDLHYEKYGTIRTNSNNNNKVNVNNIPEYATPDFDVIGLDSINIKNSNTNNNNDSSKSKSILKLKKTRRKSKGKSEILVFPNTLLL